MRKPIALALLVLAAPLAADTPAPGFSSSVLPTPQGYLTVTLSNGQLVGLGSQSVALFSPAGGLIQTLHTYPFSTEPIDPYLIEVDPSETFVIVVRENAESGDTYRVELTGGGTLLTQAPSWVAFEDSDSALFSTVFFPNQWRLSRVDVVTGAEVLLGSASGGFIGGAIALDGSSNLYLGYDDGGPNTSYVVERFSAAQLVPGGVAKGAGVLVHQGSGYLEELDLSPDGSTLYAVESVPLIGSQDRIVAVPLDGSAPPRELVKADPDEDLLRTEVRPGTPPAAFLAFQPASGGEIIYQTLLDFDWERNALRPERPSLILSGPGTTGIGTVDLTITGGPPNGQAMAFRGPLSLYNPTETAILVSGIPIFIGLDLETAMKVPVPIPLDPTGNGVRQFNNASGATGLWAIQASLFNAQGSLVGTTTAAFL